MQSNRRSNNRTNLRNRPRTTSILAFQEHHAGMHFVRDCPFANHTCKSCNKVGHSGGEYKAKRLGQFYRANGIVPQYTADYSPQQNGAAERKNRTLVEMARCMLLDAKLGHRHWAEAINAAVYLQNILPSISVEKTSFELWYGKQPDYSNLHIFGSAAIVHVPAEKRKKLDPKGKKLTFVGYADNHKAFRFIDVSTDKVPISRDAQFIEMEEPKTQNSFDHPGSLQVVEY